MAARHLATLEPAEWAEPSPAPDRDVVIRLDARMSRPVSRSQRLRRRRLVALVGVSLLFLGSVALVQSIVATEPTSAPSLEPLSAVEGDTYVVQQGDTLWTIARRLAPDDDPRPLVAAMRSQHGGAELDTGDRLRFGDAPDG